MTSVTRGLLWIEDGQDLIEYAILAALLSVALIGILGLITGGTQNIFTRVIGVLH